MTRMVHLNHRSHGSDTACRSRRRRGLGELPGQITNLECAAVRVPGALIGLGTWWPHPGSIVTAPPRNGFWWAQVDHFADRYRVVLIDPPGHGGSQKLTAAFTFEQCAQCVVDETALAADMESCSWAVRSVVSRRPDQRALLARVTTPVLVVVGAEDSRTPSWSTRWWTNSWPVDPRPSVPSMA